MSKRILWTAAWTCIVAITVITGGARAASPALWYDAPARDWQSQALPIGNGRLAAMIFGGVDQEHIQINEGSLWIGDEKTTGAYQSLGDLYIDFGPQKPEAYRRELNLGDALHTVTYKSAGVTYRRESFASFPANVMVFRFTADKPGSLTGTVKLADAHKGTLTAVGDRITDIGSLAGYTFHGDPPYAFALSYEAQIRVLHDGGTLTASDGKIRFDHANSVTLLVDAGTDFVQDRSKHWRGDKPHDAITRRIDAAAKRSFDDLLAEHEKDYRRLFDRVTLDLGGSPTDAALPTDRRIEQVSKTHRQDAGLESLVFQYGRYLLIASSRPGDLPANLQGKWNNSNNPPWRCDYHTDINVQMNYWPADVANLGECFEPYAAWLNSIREVRKEATAAAYHTRGWTMRAENGPFGGSTWEWIQPASAWCMQNIWTHYEFTGDKEYLRRTAYPMMKEVCEFWLDRLKPLPDGTLVVTAVYSPEHGPRADGTSFGQELVWDLFTNTIAAADTLGVDRAFRDGLAAKRAKLWVPKIGKWGQLQEWMKDIDNPKDTHRHLSHLVGLYPGHQITLEGTPKLAAAARVSLTARGDVSTGWSTAWKISLWARLHDGDHAYRILSNLLTLVGYGRGGGGLYANLFDSCPPFQIDGNFGCVAGVCEMLLQSHTGVIELLPALPAAWPNGSVTGLRARGGFTVDITWQNGRVVKYRVTSPEPHDVKVRVNGQTITVRSTAA